MYFRQRNGSPRASKYVVPDMKEKKKKSFYYTYGRNLLFVQIAILIVLGFIYAITRSKNVKPPPAEYLQTRRNTIVSNAENIKIPEIPNNYVKTMKHRQFITDKIPNKNIRHNMNNFDNFDNFKNIENNINNFGLNNINNNYNDIQYNNVNNNNILERIKPKEMMKKKEFHGYYELVGDLDLYLTTNDQYIPNCVHKNTYLESDLSKDTIQSPMRGCDIIHNVTKEGKINYKFDKWKVIRHQLGLTLADSDLMTQRYVHIINGMNDDEYSKHLLHHYGWLDDIKKKKKEIQRQKDLIERKKELDRRAKILEERKKKKEAKKLKLAKLIKKKKEQIK